MRRKILRTRRKSHRVSVARGCGRTGLGTEGERRPRFPKPGWTRSDFTMSVAGRKQWLKKSNEAVPRLGFC
jgi:hypothetical protein